MGKKILGVDYGRRKLGLALSSGFLAEPFGVVRISSLKEGVEKAVRVVQVEKVDKIVVGVSEGEMGEEQRDFAQRLKERLGSVIVEVWDETLSTYDARGLAREAGVARHKIRGREDAFAAAVMLQSFLDTHGKESEGT